MIYCITFQIENLGCYRPEVEAVRTIPAGSVVKFIKGLMSRFGIPNCIITDNGSQFTINLFEMYCANLGMQVSYASVVHPRSNG